MGKTTVCVLIICILVMAAFFIVMESFRERALNENVSTQSNILKSLQSSTMNGTILQE